MSTDPESRGGFGPYLRAVGPEYEDNGVVKTIRYGEISDLARALELHGKNTAAFLVEPIQGEAGYVLFPCYCLYLIACRPPSQHCCTSRGLPGGGEGFVQEAQCAVYLR